MKRVNFGAVLVAALLVQGCSQRDTTQQSTDGSSPVAATGVAAAGGSQDPMLAIADKARTAGDSTAATWMIIASDFQCPYCRQWHAETYHKLVSEYVNTGKVRLAYLHYPLPQHRNAMITAQAAMCAGVQGRFWEYHDGLFESQQRWQEMADPRPVLDSLARSERLDTAVWGECLASGRMTPMVIADRDRVSAAGVRSTPSFLVGGSMVMGALPIDSLRPVLDAAIARGGTSPR